MPQHANTNDAMIAEARNIAQQPYINYETVVSNLESSDLLAPMVKLVKNEYSSTLTHDAQGVFPNQKDWEMITALWLYDKETADHSVDVCRIAREKIDRELPGGIVLSDVFKQPNIGITREEFLRACLFHDIGKIAMPIEILTNRTSDIECADILLENPKEAEKLLSEKGLFLEISAEKILDELRAHNIRPQQILPLRMIIPKNRFEDINQQLVPFNLSTENTIIEILNTHEKFSHDILSSVGLKAEAILAGTHHSKHTDTVYVAEIGNPPIKIDLADIVHLADVKQAMISKRYYKKSGSPLALLSALINHAERKLVSKKLTYLWVVDEFNTLKNSDTDAEDLPHLAQIIDFLEREKTT